MKKRDLEKRLRGLGWYFLRSGGKHDIWTNGTETEQLPRHREVNEFTARGILGTATQHPGDKKKE